MPGVSCAADVGSSWTVPRAGLRAHKNEGPIGAESPKRLLPLLLLRRRRLRLRQNFFLLLFFFFFFVFVFVFVIVVVVVRSYRNPGQEFKQIAGGSPLSHRSSTTPVFQEVSFMCALTF